MARLFKKPKVSRELQIPAAQFKKLGVGASYLKVYIYLSNHPTASHHMISKETGYSAVHVRQILFRLRHWFHAIRKIDGYAVCDLRLGSMARKWKKNLMEVFPKDQWELYFDEDGNRRYQIDGVNISQTSARIAFATEMISGDLIKYLLAGGKIKMKPWEYWDFAKKIGCPLGRMVRPSQDIMELAVEIQDMLRPGTVPKQESED